uniref:MADF domain-containing protein n=2 Tax=Caenorhabditis japonica TaxID=281687 RepID=A0A8R1E9A2_CAEJA
MGPDTDCEVIDDVMDNHGDLENKNKMDAKHLKVAMTKTDSYKKLTHAQCLRVIHAVEENPQIWNMRDDGYKDIQAKNTLWAEMEKSMEFLRRDHGMNLVIHFNA